MDDPRRGPTPGGEPGAGQQDHHDDDHPHDTPAVGQRGYTPRSAWPELTPLLDAVRAELRDTPHACPHVGRGRGSVGFICAQHPRAGVLCERCMTAHTRRHSWVAEHVCDIPGCSKDDTVDGLTIIAPSIVGMGVVVNPKHGRGLLIGSVFVNTIGVCRSCATGRPWRGVA